MKAASVIALGLTAVAFAQNKDDWPRIPIGSLNPDIKMWVVCETSDASPLWHQINNAAWKIDGFSNKESRCVNDNQHGSQCSKVEESDDRGARISLCGRLNQATDCGIVSTLARGIVEKCADGGDRAGGWGEWERNDFGRWSKGLTTVVIERL